MEKTDHFSCQLSNVHKDIVKDLSKMQVDTILTVYRYTGILVYGTNEMRKNLHQKF